MQINGKHPTGNQPTQSQALNFFFPGRAPGLLGLGEARDPMGTGRGSWCVVKEPGRISRPEESKDGDDTGEGAMRCEVCASERRRTRTSGKEEGKEENPVGDWV